MHWARTHSGGGDDQEPADLDEPFDAAHEFGWDNESPPRVVQVKRVRMEWRPISNVEYFEFWTTKKDEVEMPKSWVLEDGVVKVCYIPRESTASG